MDFHWTGRQRTHRSWTDEKVDGRRLPKTGTRIDEENCMLCILFFPAMIMQPFCLRLPSARLVPADDLMHQPNPSFLTIGPHSLSSLVLCDSLASGTKNGRCVLWMSPLLPTRDSHPSLAPPVCLCRHFLIRCWRCLSATILIPHTLPSCLADVAALLSADGEEEGDPITDGKEFNEIATDKKPRSQESEERD